MITSPHRCGATFAGWLILAVSACVSAPPAPPPPAAPPAPPPLDASYDWHGLLLVPFNSVLKEVPFTLHEVLLFRDAAHAAQGDDAECYAVEQPAPRFLTRIPSEYMLCFRHDHLVRVQATVNLPKSEGARIFSDACGLWRRHANATQAPEPVEDAVPIDASASPIGCEGRDGAIAYHGRLDQDADPGDIPLTINLDASVQP